jgi:hypothetical protein
MALLRGVRDAKIRKWVSAPMIYTGTTYDLLGVNQAEFTDRINEDTAEGDDAEIDYFSEAVGAEVRLRFFDETEVGMDVIALITNQTLSSDASGHERMRGGRGRYNYVGLCVQVYDVDGVSDRHYFARKAKATNVAYTPSYGGYMVKEINFRAVVEDTTDTNSSAYDIIEHDTAVVIAIPPTWTP